jgi:hypothetical protein
MNTYGLLIRRENRYGTEYISAQLVKREDGHDAPRGVLSEYDRPKHLEGLHLENLGIEGFILDDGHLCGFQPGYRSVHHAYEHDVVAMAKTLKLINAKLRKDAAEEPGDILASFAAALKLSFVVEMRSRDSYYNSANQWRWMSIAEGRNRFRQLVADAKEATKTNGKLVA